MTSWILRSIGGKTLHECYFNIRKSSLENWKISTSKSIKIHPVAGPLEDWLILMCTENVLRWWVRNPANQLIWRIYIYYYHYYYYYYHHHHYYIYTYIYIWLFFVVKDFFNSSQLVRQISEASDSKSASSPTASLLPCCLAAERVRLLTLPKEPAASWLHGKTRLGMIRFVTFLIPEMEVT